jgi:dynamin 1-like protein
MELLIPTVNKLQDVLGALGADSAVDLPQIVTVGSQSSGKSSVAESLVNRSFLPRGSGIVTRRPLILQLRHVDPTPGRAAEWGEFLHKPGAKFTDFAEIRDEITRETDRLTGVNKGISDQPINLRVFSPHVVDLTLVDLPGIAKVPVGDQPKDIEAQIRAMILSYISKPNAIILAVTAANNDLATSDALQIAQQVDPTGERTVGVLTKLDLMDKGTHAGDILAGQAHSLGLGWCGVVLRSQADIQAGTSITDARRAEEDFFLTHPVYRLLDRSRLGVTSMAQTLNRVLLRHIQNTLPELRARIDNQLHHYQAELTAAGDFPSTRRAQGALILRLIGEYAHAYAETIDGLAPGAARTQLYGGARISYVFHEVLGQLFNHVEKLALSPDEIRTILRNATGPTPSLFIPEHAFELIARRSVRRLEPPALRCADLVKSELVTMTRHVPSADMRRYPLLTSRVVVAASELLEELQGPARAFITDAVRLELTFVNTRHPDFAGPLGSLSSVAMQPMAADSDEAAAGSAASDSKVSRATKDKKAATSWFTSESDVPAASDAKKHRHRSGSASGTAAGSPPADLDVPDGLRISGTATQSEEFAMRLIPDLLSSYYAIVRKKIEDTVPKALMFFVVMRSKEQMQAHLTAQLFREDLFDELLAIDPSVAAARARAERLVAHLTRAQAVLDEVREVQLPAAAPMALGALPALKKVGSTPVADATRPSSVAEGG